MDKEWVRKIAEEQVNAIYGLKNPTADEVSEMVDKHFAPTPVRNLPGGF